MKTIITIACTFLTTCKPEQRTEPVSSMHSNSLQVVCDITPPAGYQRTATTRDSFAGWLQQIALKKGPTVYLHNGLPKKNQSAQYVILDVPVGKRDLQQCADAIMRLRAEYLFATKRFDEISFSDNAQREYKWTGGNKRGGFESYLANVFGSCGSASLEKQLKPVDNLNEIQAGDVFIEGGFPGHAMIVIDIAVDKRGEKLFMLAQSYMPAQDIHIVRNPLNLKLNPWYRVSEIQDWLRTPEWSFRPGHLRRW